MAVNHKLRQTVYSNKVSSTPNLAIAQGVTPFDPARQQSSQSDGSPGVQPGVGLDGQFDANTDKAANDLGKLARGSQLIFNNIPVEEQRIVEDFYREPLVIGSLREEPFGIELVRIINLAAPTLPTTTGGMCHFTWLPAKGGASIASIDGMSVAINGTTKFRFYFRVTYKME